MKQTLFIRGDAYLSVKEFVVEGKKNTVVVLHVNNDEYDES